MNLKQHHCNVPGCKNIHSAKGFCNLHYGRIIARRLNPAEINPAELIDKIKAGRPRLMIKNVPLKMMSAYQGELIKVTKDQETNYSQECFSWDEGNVLL